MTSLSPTWEEQAEETASDLTRNDRFSAVAVILTILVAIGLGLLMRQSNLSKTWTYRNPQAGIEAVYPAGWLVDEGGEYVARLRDPRARPFKTQYVLSIVPAGGETSVRNVLDNLTLQRSVNLPAYRVLDVRDIHSGGTRVTEMSFAFVATDPNPFIERLPVVVLGRDKVILDGNRAIIMTFMCDEDSFENNLERFERFVVSLQY